MVNRNYSNISCKALGQLISLKGSASRKVAKNSVYDRENTYYLPAIRLFILLNFKVNTKDGKASELLIKELAEETGCCTKTVISSLDRLSSGDEPLITYSIDDETKLLSVSILNYTDMFKRSGEGGLRYLVFGTGLLKELNNLKNVNEMRLCLRALIECEEQEGKEASLSLKEILAGLPSYIRPCNVRAYINKFKDVLTSTPNINSSAFHFEISRMNDGKYWKRRMLSLHERSIMNLVEEFNVSINNINTINHLSPSDKESRITSSVADDVNAILKVDYDWKEARDNNIKVLPLFHFKRREFEDASLIATHLDLDSVTGAIRKYMESFVLKGRGSTRSDTMAIIQNIAEKLYIKNKNFFSLKDKEDESYLNDVTIQLAT